MCVMWFESSADDCIQYINYFTLTIWSIHYCLVKTRSWWGMNLITLDVNSAPSYSYLCDWFTQVLVLICFPLCLPQCNLSQSSSNLTLSPGTSLRFSLNRNQWRGFVRIGEGIIIIKLKFALKRQSQYFDRVRQWVQSYPSAKNYPKPTNLRKQTPPFITWV